MRASHSYYSVRGLVALGLGVLLLPALFSVATAQGRAAATVTRLEGRVEIMRQQRSTWVPAVVGVQLAVGDAVRTFGASSALLELSDGSTFLVVENSRLVVSQQLQTSLGLTLSPPSGTTTQLSTTPTPTPAAGPSPTAPTSFGLPPQSRAR